jgi:hypothetical protein
MQQFRREASLLLALCLAAGACGKKAETPSSGAPGTADTTAAGATTPAAPVPPTVVHPSPEAAPADRKPGLLRSTFANNRFEGAAKDDVANDIGFNCEKDPYGGREVGVRWSGWLTVEKEGRYCFEVLSDDEARLYLGGVVVVAQLESTLTRTAELALKAGTYQLRVDWQNNVGAACLRFRWAAGSCENPVPIEARLLSH